MSQKYPAPAARATAATKPPAARVVRDIRRRARKQHSAEEKIRVVLEGLRGEDSIAALCRREGIAESLYYARMLLCRSSRAEGGPHRLRRDAKRRPRAPAPTQGPCPAGRPSNTRPSAGGAGCRRSPAGRPPWRGRACCGGAWGEKRVACAPPARTNLTQAWLRRWRVPTALAHIVSSHAQIRPWLIRRARESAYRPHAVRA